MPQFDTEYTPAGIRTTTSAPQIGAMPGLDPHLTDIANQVIQMRLAAAQRRQEDEMRERQRQQAAQARADMDDRIERQRPVVHGAPSGSGILGGGGVDGGKGTIQQQMQSLAYRDALNQVQAKERTAPMRTVSGPGIIPGQTLDVDKLNGYTRPVYLPDSAQQLRF